MPYGNYYAHVFATIAVAPYPNEQSWMVRLGVLFRRGRRSFASGSG
jgi:hypothetical protein